MFTIKVVNKESHTSSMFTYESAIVHYCGSKTFAEYVEDLKYEDKHDPDLSEAHQRYIALIRDITSDRHYLVDECDEVYIMNESGNTVEVIR